jgi:hypothetical protein
MMMIIWIVTVVYGSLDICLSKDIKEKRRRRRKRKEEKRRGRTSKET